MAVFPPPGPFAYRSAEHESQVVKLILEDEPVHLATLAYQDVQLNVSGTMSVDSAILDRPIVNVYYDPPGVPAGLSVRRFYDRSDYRPIVSSGGVRLAHSAEECVELVNRYLDEPALWTPRAGAGSGRPTADRSTEGRGSGSPGVSPSCSVDRMRSCEAHMAEAMFLDGQYLRFLAETEEIWDRYPALAGLRYALFKSLLIRRQRLSLASLAARPWRSARRWRHTDLPRCNADVLFLIETGREVVSGALLPVHRELQAARYALRTSRRGVGALSMLARSTRLSTRRASSRQAWSRRAWEDIGAVVSDLRGPRLEPHFFALAAAEQGRRDELARVIERSLPAPS